jgi:antitoxin ParD1/3/4
MSRPTTSFALGDHYRAFAKRKVREGRFASNSEVMRAAMRLLEEHEARLDQLKKAIQAGLDSGPSEPFDLQEFLREQRDRT